MNSTMHTGTTGLSLPAVSLSNPSNPSNPPKVRRAARLMAAACGAASVAAGVLAGGCGADPKPTQLLSPGAFVAHTGDNSSINNPLDKPGAIQYDTYRVVQSPPVQASPPPVEVGRTVRELVKSPEAEARQEAANIAGHPPQGPETAPATAPAAVGAQAHGWLLHGCVLEQVNGTGIFSNTVVSSIQKPLIREAKLGNEAHFSQIAADQYSKAIQGYERDELEYAAAQRALVAEDEQQARGMTMQWRQKKITEAGGSLEMARRRAADDGWDFEKEVEQQYRLNMSRIYYQKHIYPLIQVTAADLRDYYDVHKDTEFTTHGQARFRVIKIDPRDHLGREDALNIAEGVQKRAAAEDFAELARSKDANDDSTGRASGGAVGGRDGFVQKGAFRVQEVEDAVWKLRPGQVTDIIRADGCFFIAKLEQLTQDKVEDFDTAEVQERIRDLLTRQQFNALREKHVSDLVKEAVIYRNEDAIRETLASIIEQYPLWRQAK